MRLLLVCPHFPPEPCGVGDYTSRLAARLAQDGHGVSVITAQAAPRPVAGAAIHSLPYPWNPARLGEALRLARAEKPDAVVIQYTPYLYAPRFYGIHAGLPAWVLALRAALKAPVAVMAHEPHYPVGLGIDRLAIGLPQFAVWNALALAADRVFVSIEPWWQDLVRRFPKRAARFSWLPVGANIDPRLDGGLSEPPVGADLPEGARVLLHFGSGHVTRRFDLSFASLAAAVHAYGSRGAALVMAGVSPEQVSRELLGAGQRGLSRQVYALGYVSNRQAAAWIARADLVLGPFLDGISTRRGSAMAAFAQGRALLSNRGFHSDPSVPWEDFCGLAPTSSLEAFGSRAAELLGDAPLRERLGRAAERIYRERFDWPVIAGRMVAELKLATRGP